MVAIAASTESWLETSSSTVRSCREWERAYSAAASAAAPVAAAEVADAGVHYVAEVCESANGHGTDTARDPGDDDGL